MVSSLSSRFARAVILGMLAALFLASATALAQDNARDYAITTPLVSYMPGGASALVSFSVSNQGGDALEDSTITIAENESGRVVASDGLSALAAGQSYDYEVELALEQFPEGDVFLKVEVGIDQYELAGSAIARDNSQLFRINRAEAAASAGPYWSDSPAGFDFVLPLLNIGIKATEDGIQINDSQFSQAQLLIGGLGLILALLLLWFLLMVLRRLFRRAPAFGPWQPPYQVASYLHPESTEARRQSWQFHARNSAIQAPCTPNNLAVVKRLVNAEGRAGFAMDAWWITGMRSEQYDVYGRVSRTEAVMPSKIVKKLNRLAERSSQMDNQELHKALQPIAKQMSKAMLRRIEKQNRSLPIALDIRFAGSVGEAQIVFELYQCRNAAWSLLDQWQPELSDTGEHIAEQYSYSLNGLLPGESYREFKARAPQDLTQLLGGLLYQHQAEVEVAALSPLSRSSDHEEETAVESRLAAPAEDTAAIRSQL